MKKTVLLAIFDGLGIAKPSPSNAFTQAATPNFDTLFKNHLTTTLVASGKAVGLLANTMGNSEVGHITIGAGRVVKQSLTQITNAVKAKTFFTNPLLEKFLVKIAIGNKRLHIMGLASHGRVHSDIAHLYAICKAVKHRPINVYLHLFLDGRDTKKDVALATIMKFEKWLVVEKINNISLVSLSGRYYSMDRDCRFERTTLAINAMKCCSDSKIATFRVASKYIAKNYANGIFDEFIQPAFLEQHNPNGAIRCNDAMICFNFRPDRVIQIASALSNPEYAKKIPISCPQLKLLIFKYYSDSVKAQILYPQIIVEETLGVVVANAGLTQLRIAETEKIAHVTYFFDGGRNLSMAGREQILIPSDRSVATYDLNPKMRAMEISRRVIAEIGKYDLIVLNFANADMVGHTGNLSATIAAIECLDEQIARISKKLDELDGTLIITADHGNAEQMVNNDGSICKTHTHNFVPLCVTSRAGWRLLNNAKIPSLIDVAPTILWLLNLKKPSLMVGESLITTK